MFISELLDGIDACIFDMDGTLVDSLHIWEDIDKRFFNIHDMQVPQDYDKMIAHMSFIEMAEFTKKKYKFKESVFEIMETWLNWSKEAYVNTIQEKENVKEVLSYLKEKHIPLSLATANKKELYEPCLKRLDLNKYFDYILNINDINSTKQEPTIYLNLASKMNSKIERTLVFEDILIAVKTAKDANFKVCGVYDKNNVRDEEEIKKLSDYYLYSFSSLQLK